MTEPMIGLRSIMRVATPTGAHFTLSQEATSIIAHRILSKKRPFIFAPGKWKGFSPAK